jgi:hypothetical protein
MRDEETHELEIAFERRNVIDVLERFVTAPTMLCCDCSLLVAGTVAVRKNTKPALRVKDDVKGEAIA